MNPGEHYSLKEITTANFAEKRCRNPKSITNVKQITAMIMNNVQFIRIGRFIMGLFDLFKKDHNTHNNDFVEDAVFEHILNVFFAFKDKFPDKIVSLDIYPSRKITGYVAFDISFFLDGKISWYQSKETNEMLEFFKLIEDDGTFMTFEYVHNTFEESNNRNYIDSKLKSYIKHFMQLNPTRNFDLSRTGANIKYW